MKTKKSTLKQILVLLGVMTGVLALFNMIPVAGAQSMLSTGDNIGAVSQATGGETDLRELIKTLINYALGFLGLFAVIMVIYGGFLYVSSAGDEEKVGKGKNIILYAVIGIIIILLSFVLVNAVLGAAANSGPTTVQ